jgi:3-deoxy-D-manno-octulosonate 8-phosphate phosphatase (KDO 8-P phosphatase)
MSDCSPTAGYLSDCEILAGYRARSLEKCEQRQSPQRQLALARARETRLLLLDVDGVLTDGCLLYGPDGAESKSFHTQDGFGLRLLREAGIDTGIITARTSEVVTRRAEELRMRHIYLAAANKSDAFREIVAVSGLKPFQIAYMGDDWLDLPVLQQVGLAIAPGNAVAAVREMVHFITPEAGGHGAVRAACELILEGRALLDEMLQRYRSR